MDATKATQVALDLKTCLQTITRYENRCEIDELSQLAALYVAKGALLEQIMEDPYEPEEEGDVFPEESRQMSALRGEVEGLKAMLEALEPLPPKKPVRSKK